MGFLAGLEGEFAPTRQVGVVRVAGRSGGERGPSCPASFGQRERAGVEVFEAVHAAAREDLREALDPGADPGSWCAPFLAAESAAAVAQWAELSTVLAAEPEGDSPSFRRYA